MAIISFSKTIEPYRRRIKTVTRRDWKDSYLERWQRWFDEGRVMHDAWTQLPRVAGARKMGNLRLTERPYRERLADMPEEELEAEGGMCDTLGEFFQLIDVPTEREVAVIRFEPLPFDPID